MARIVLINPRFEASYWGLEHALPIVGKRANLPTACLPLLAALTPSEHEVTLIDENVGPIDFDAVARADIVGLTGMSVQRRRMTEILRELKARGVFCVVGGPWVTVREDYFGPLADAIFVGEAEDTWPRFLREWEAGAHGRRYEQTERTDMARVPVLRYDLLDMGRYLFGSVQFSRGCPFQCEFCDIIVTFGRRPRLKTSGQILAELDELRANRVEIVFVVDDNLIGNKSAIRETLRDIAGWQHEPVSYFDRLDGLFLRDRFRFGQPRSAYLRRRPLRRLRANAVDALRALGVFSRLMLTVRDPKLRRIYRQRFLRMLRRRREPQVWMVYAIKCVIHYHHYTMSRQMTPAASTLVNTF